MNVEHYHPSIINWAWIAKNTNIEELYDLAIKYTIFYDGTGYDHEYRIHDEDLYINFDTYDHLRNTCSIRGLIKYIPHIKKAKCENKNCDHITDLGSIDEDNYDDMCRGTGYTYNSTDNKQTVGDNGDGTYSDITMYYLYIKNPKYDTEHIRNQIDKYLNSYNKNYYTIYNCETVNYKISIEYTGQQDLNTQISIEDFTWNWFKENTNVLDILNNPNNIYINVHNEVFEELKAVVKYSPNNIQTYFENNDVEDAFDLLNNI